MSSHDTNKILKDNRVYSTSVTYTAVHPKQKVCPVFLMLCFASESWTEKSLKRSLKKKQNTTAIYFENLRFVVIVFQCQLTHRFWRTA